MAKRSSKKYRVLFKVCSRRFVDIFFLLALLAHAAGVRAENKPGLRQYYPIVSDLSWEYTVEENSTFFSQYVECTTKADSEFVLCTKSLRHSQYFFSIDSSIVKLSRIKLQLSCIPVNFTIHVEPSLPVFHLAGKTGDTWKWEGQFVSFIYRKKAVVRTEICGIRKLENQSQDMMCLELKTEIRIDGKVDTLVAFYSRGIGLVKQISNHQNKDLIKYCQNGELHDVAISIQRNNGASAKENVKSFSQPLDILFKKVLPQVPSVIYK